MIIFQCLFFSCRAALFRSQLHQAMIPGDDMQPGLEIVYFPFGNFYDEFFENLHGGIPAGFPVFQVFKADAKHKVHILLIQLPQVFQIAGGLEAYRSANHPDRYCSLSPSDLKNMCWFFYPHKPLPH
jgi:hypothetical protein